VKCCSDLRRIYQNNRLTALSAPRTAAEIPALLRLFPGRHASLPTIRVMKVACRADNFIKRQQIEGR
jgi:hypothetical protein